MCTEHQETYTDSMQKLRKNIYTDNLYTYKIQVTKILNEIHQFSKLHTLGREETQHYLVIMYT